MGKETWFSTLSEGLCEKCLKVFEENRKALDDRLKREREIGKLAFYLGGKRQAMEFLFEKADKKLNTMTREVFDGFDPSKENIFVHGGTGTSKTFFSTCAARRALDAGKKVRMYNARELNWDLQKSAVDGTLRLLIDRLVGLDVFGLDDLGASRASDFRIDGIMEILEKRYYAGRPGLMIMSNSDLDGIAEIFSDRVSSRIRGMCKPPHGRVVEVKGTDARLRVV